MKKTKINPFKLLQRIRTDKPVIHHLTNWVTIYDCANIVKVIGGSPVMAHAKEEVAQMASIASSLVLNIGTLTPEFAESAKIAARSANKKGIPVILDVCGAGATQLRDQKSLELLNQTKINIIKGNASEIARINGEQVSTKGVDSAEIKKDLFYITRNLALKYKATVVATGKEDIITNGEKIYLIKNGHPIMAHIVGTGCMATSIIGTFAAVEKDLTLASACALVCFEIAAQLAVKTSKGPGTFKEKLYDHIYKLNATTIQKMQNVYTIAID